MSTFSWENEAFVAFAKYSSVILLKMILMSGLTGFYRIKHNSHLSREDAVKFVGEDEDKIKQILAPNAEVERVTAAHRNDMENIVPFVMISLLYLTTNPDPCTAGLLFKIFAAARVTHTFVYLGKVRQPTRSLAFGCGLVVNVFMASSIVIKSWM